ncbi:MAG: UMP kinase [archaeon]|nr:UMP kinase [archaeon]
MKTLVISLGGSIIIPKGEMNVKFLHNFKQILLKNTKNIKFVIVCGGGSIARKYIEALKGEHKSEKALSLAGIRATRMNALFLMQLIGEKANSTLPMDMKEVKSNLKKNPIVICGALRYAEKSTSDGTAAKLANYLEGEFINMTNVKGLYTKDPRKHRDAKFISKISWKDFDVMANKSKYAPGQHFVLDQSASKLIKKHKIKTYIIGEDLTNLIKILQEKNFIGTLIS